MYIHVCKGPNFEILAFMYFHNVNVIIYQEHVCGNGRGSLFFKVMLKLMCSHSLDQNILGSIGSWCWSCSKQAHTHAHTHVLLYTHKYFMWPCIYPKTNHMSAKMFVFWRISQKYHLVDLCWYIRMHVRMNASISKLISPTIFIVGFHVHGHIHGITGTARPKHSI